MTFPFYYDIDGNIKPSKKKVKVIQCRQCGETKKRFVKGFCITCYSKNRYKGIKLKCFDCGSKTAYLIRFLCYQCYRSKFLKMTKPTKSNWICDCSPPDPDLHPFIEKQCKRCLKIRSNKKI